MCILEWWILLDKNGNMTSVLNGEHLFEKQFTEACL